MSTEKYKGLFKLIEEAGEVIQVAGKLGPFPHGEHPDGQGDLGSRLEAEIADLYAAMDYVVKHNYLDYERIKFLRVEKTKKFEHWTLTGIKI